ncbi:MAG: LysM peptidoglycan-binding domain-containing protein [Thiolinea sp.]
MSLNNMFIKTLSLSGVMLFPIFSVNTLLAADIDCKVPYTVSSGDTLGEIAERAYDSSAKYNLIYYANKNVLKSGAAVIRIGQKLRIPCFNDEEETVDSKETQTEKQTADAEKAETSETVTAVKAETQESAKNSVTGATTETTTQEPAKAEVTTLASKPVSSASTGLVQSRRRVDLLTAGDYAPFTDPDLPGGGLVTELLESAMKTSDITYRLNWINDWSAHLDPLLSEKKYDIGFPWLNPGCPESDSPRCNFLFSKPVFELLIVLFTRAEQPLKFVEDGDILGKTLCRPTGYFTHDLDNNGRNWLKEGKITLEQPKNVKDCFELLVEGKVDAVAINDFTGREFIAKLGIKDKVVPLERELSIEGLHALVHKTHPRATILINRINRGLEKLHVSGQYDEIMDRHLLNHWKSVESDQ